MAKGSYNISVSDDSNLEDESSEVESKSRKCMNSCLKSAFLRSLSFHDRPRSSRVPSKKEFRCTQYKPLVSSSLEKISSDLLLPSEKRSSACHRSESVGIDETEKTTQSLQLTERNQLFGFDNWLEDRCMRFGVESKKILEKTIAILRAVDRDISESLINLTKPESIALESVSEVYRNKGKGFAGSFVDSKSDLSTESLSKSSNENRQSSVKQKFKNVQTHSTPRRLNDLQSVTPRQNPKNLQSVSPQQSPKSLQAHSTQQSPKSLQPHSTQASPKSLQPHSTQASPENLQPRSTEQNPKSLQAHSTQESPKNSQAHSTQQSPKISQAHSTQQSPKISQVHSTQQSPKISQVHSTQQSPKISQVHSTQQSPKNLQSLLSSNSENAQNPIKPDGDNRQSVKRSPGNVSLSSPNRIAPDNTTGMKSRIEFDLPSDHEQFVKIIGALQNRCLEYREMIQDIAVSALEVCLNCSEFPVSRIRQLRKQFESQKINFRDFKELCCKSVVFGPDSQPIDEKVTEVIQSFYLKLLQEENETFMVRLEFGLKMADVYATMLKFETDSKEAIMTMEKEIFYLKKISIGFKV